MEICSLTFLEARSLRQHHDPLKVSRGGSFPASPSSSSPRCSLACGSITASSHDNRPSVCVSVPKFPSSYTSKSYTGLEPTLIALSYLDSICKGPISNSKYDYFTGTRGYNFNISFRRTGFNPQQYLVTKKSIISFLGMWVYSFKSIMSTLLFQIEKRNKWRHILLKYAVMKFCIFTRLLWKIFIFHLNRSSSGNIFKNIFD